MIINDIEPKFELTTVEQEILRCVVGHMIPASNEFKIPGADEPSIFADILGSIERDHLQIREALQAINSMADGQLSATSEEEQLVVLSKFRSINPELVAVIETTTVRCYYRNDQVMNSIGMEARPPFPLGYEVSQGDWALLDPVMARGKMYRNADEFGG